MSILSEEGFYEEKFVNTERDSKNAFGYLNQNPIIDPRSVLLLTVNFKDRYRHFLLCGF